MDFGCSIEHSEITSDVWIIKKTHPSHICMDSVFNKCSLWMLFTVQLYSFRADYSKKKTLQNKKKLIQFQNYCYIRVFKTLRNPAIFILFLIIPVFELSGNISSPTFTFMHLADAFIQSDLQCIQTIDALSVCVFPGNWTHNLLRC